MSFYLRSHMFSSCFSGESGVAGCLLDPQGVTDTNIYVAKSTP